MSYSATVFELQDQINCSSSDQPVCVDWVNHLIGGLAQSHKVCGNGETGKVHSDGENSMLVEFVANRDSVLPRGFHYTVYCIAPAFDLNAVRQGAVPATPGQRRAAAQCTSPDSSRKKRQSYYSPQVYPTLCIYHIYLRSFNIITLLQPTAEPTTQPSSVLLVLEMTHYLSFNYMTLNVHRGEYGVTSYQAAYLTVITRSSRTTYPLWQPINQEIRGYGKLFLG